MKSLRSVFLALMLVLGLSSAASAQDIVVANATGFTIQQLGLIDSSASGDAQDLLGNDTLANCRSPSPALRRAGNSLLLTDRADR